MPQPSSSKRSTRHSSAADSPRLLPLADVPLEGRAMPAWLLSMPLPRGRCGKRRRSSMRRSG